MEWRRGQHTTRVERLLGTTLQSRPTQLARKNAGVQTSETGTRMSCTGISDWFHTRYSSDQLARNEPRNSNFPPLFQKKLQKNENNYSKNTLEK